jgi:hypothetical protein
MSPVTQPAHSFSEYFRELDKKSMKTMHHEYYVNKEYKRLMDQWTKPLQRKQIKRERRLQNPIVPKEEQ